MAYKYPSGADLNTQLKKTDSKTQNPKQSKKNSRGHSRTRHEQQKLKCHNMSSRKEFVTIDLDAFRLTDRELQQRTENRKSKNQILGQLEAYNRTFPVQSRIAPEVTEQLLKEKVNSKTNIFDFDTVMARADRVLQETRNLLDDTPASKLTSIKFTEPSSFKKTEMAGKKYTFASKVKQSNSDGSLADNNEERLTKLLEVRPKLKKKSYQHPLLYDEDGSVFVPESRHAIYPHLPQEHLTRLDEARVTEEPSNHKSDRERARRTGSYHRHTMFSPSQSTQYLDPVPVDSSILHTGKPKSLKDSDRVLLYRTQRDLRELALFEEFVLRNAGITHETRVDPAAIRKRTKMLKYINNIRSILHQLTNTVRERDDPIEQINCDDLAKKYVEAKLSQLSLRDELKNLYPTASAYLDRRRAEDVDKEEHDLLTRTESEKLTENLKGALEKRSDKRPTRRDHKSLTLPSHIIYLKRPGKTEEFPKESRMDIQQEVVPTDLKELGRFHTTPPRYIPRYAIEEPDEPNVQLSHSDASCSRQKMKEYLKKLEKYRD